MSTTRYEALPTEERKTTPFSSVVLSTELKPNALSGICCPVGTIYNHEHLNVVQSQLNATQNVASTGRFAMRNVLVGSELGLHLIALIAQLMNATKRDEFYMENHNSMDQEELEKEIIRQVYLSPCEKSFFWCVMGIWVLWNIFTRFFFFVYYVERRQGNMVQVGQMTESPLKGKTMHLIAKLFFPLSTVYYHEGNTLIACKTLMAYLLGCFYTIPCYKPTYEENPNLVAAEIYTV